MRIIVLGAGVIGVTSAWFLNQAGHEVTVIERAPEAARETSFANGGQISVCHAEPWANPKTPWKVLQWLGEEDAPLLFHLRADPALWRWGWRFLRECSAARARANLRHLVKLGLYSRSLLQALRRETGIRYDERSEGILHFYTNSVDFESAIPAVTLMQDMGLDRQIKSTAECLAIEPALVGSRRPIVGGTYTPSDESGDARCFTNALVRLCDARSVGFRYGCTIGGFVVNGGEIEAVRVNDERGESLLVADAFLVCLGSYSALHLRPLGIRLDLYPAKGYSATIALGADDIAPTVSLTDDGYKLVFSRLGERLRVAGMAEFDGYNLDLNPIRCNALIQRTRTLFPRINGYDQAEFWAGLRPATPGNLPYIGRTRYANLYLNTGHGTLGWTESCGSGHAIADLMSDKVPEIEFPFVDGV